MLCKAKFVSNYDFFKISIAQHYKDKDFSHHLLLKAFVCTDLPSHPPDPVIEVVADDAELPYLISPLSRHPLSHRSRTGIHCPSPYLPSQDAGIC